MILIVFLIAFVVFASLGFIILKTIEKHKTKLQADKKNVLLEITVSKNNELGPLAAEQMLASLHGIFRNISFKEKHFEGHQQEYLSFEIAVIDQKIRFYAWCPKHIQEFVEGQIYAQYPDIEIITVPDYTLAIQSDKTSFASVELQLKTNDFFPIKTGQHFTDKDTDTNIDPLSAITAALGKVDLHDQVWLQLICKPKGDDWHQTGAQFVQALKGGAQLKQTINNKVCKITAGQAPRRSIIQSNKLLRLSLLPLRIIWTIATVFFPKGSKTDIPKLTDTQDMQCKEIINKSNKLGYDTTIRIVYATASKIPSAQIKTKLQAITASFKQFNVATLNGFTAKYIDPQDALELYHNRSFGKTMTLNIEELSTVFHLPNISVQTPNIQWVDSKMMEPPLNLPTTTTTSNHDLTLIGETNFRGSPKKYGIKLDDRRRHVYIIGKTGMGKSALIANMAKSDILAGRGIAVVDPHGALADDILKLIPEHRKKDLIYINPADQDYPVGFNIFDGVHESKRDMITDGIISIFKRLFGHSWGPRMEYILMNTIKALLENKDQTLLGVTRMLVDKSFREQILSNVKDPIVKQFWEEEFSKVTDRNLAEWVGPIQNKVGQFLTSTTIRNIVGQVRNKIDFRAAMDSNKIIIINLSKGMIGETNMQLLGSMLITRFQIEAMSRADISEEGRQDFSLYVDEFQNFATESFAGILSEARKYRLNITMANQYVAQMPEEVKEAIFGNVGSILMFQVGPDDAPYFSKQFRELISEADTVSLPKYNIYNTILIDGLPTKVFSSKTLPPPVLENATNIQELVDISRKRYSSPRAEVESQIISWIDQAKLASAVASGRAYVKPEHVIKDLQKDHVYHVKVNNQAAFGLFCEIDGVTGLLHVSEMSKADQESFAQKYPKGQYVDALLKDITDENKLVLSFKNLTGKPRGTRPWEENLSEEMRKTVSAERLRSEKAHISKQQIATTQKPTTIPIKITTPSHPTSNKQPASPNRKRHRPHKARSEQKQ